jgi:hypothetical protein
MKVFQTITILAIVTVVAAMTIPALAQQSSSAPAPQDQQEQQQAQPQTSDNPVQTFQGTIVLSQGKYILTTSSGTTYQLDDQKTAKAYDGKSVKVMGTLDSSGSVIQVSSIEPGS